MSGFSFMEAIGGIFDDKNLGSEIAFTGHHNTGLAPLDLFLAGRDPETGIIHPGIPFGKMITIIGPSSSGKSTLAIQMAFEIIRPFQGKAGIIHDDFERATERSRIKALSGMTDTQLNRVYRHVNDQHLYVENVYNQAEAIAEYKEQNMDNLIVNYPHPLYEGETYEVLAPTVLLIDSQAMMTSKKILDTENMTQNNMAGGQQAGLNSQMYTRLNALLRTYNIIPIVINHISKRIQTGMMPEKPLCPYLKPDENLKGGFTSLYMSDTLLRVTGGAKLEREKEFGIKGSRNKIQVIKSRSNEAGKDFETIFNQSTGFSDALTIYDFLKKNKLVGGAGRSFHLSNLPDRKFAQKDFENLFMTDPAVKEAALDLLYSDQIVNQLVPDITFTNNDDETEDMDYEAMEMEAHEEIMEEESKAKSKTSKAKGSKPPAKK